MKILLATGGSGGHIFPAVQTALELRKRGHEAIFAGSFGHSRTKVEASGFACRVIDAQGLQDKSLSGLSQFTRRMGGAFGQSLEIVRRDMPHKIIGFGGYGAFPVLMAGAMLGRPIMIHEQNVKAGKANRVLAGFARKIAVSFKDSLKFFGPKAVWTGCPCHDTPSLRSRRDICAGYGLDPKKKIIALLGGSQGSQRLNEIFFQLMQAGGKHYCGVHMTGPKEHAAYVEKYRRAAAAVHVSAFINPIEDLYAVADVVIGRAGAATVSELGVLGVPSVLVPYPFAGDHQKYNAEVLSRAGAAVMIEQKHLDGQALMKAIERCMRPEFARGQIKLKTRGLFMPDAAARLADAIESL